MRAAALILLFGTVACDSDSESAQASEHKVTARPVSNAAEETESEKRIEGPTEQSAIKPVTPVMLAKLHPWRKVSDAQLNAELQAAYALAKAEDKLVLLDFVASWCHDCVEVLKVAQQPPASDVIAQRYVYVPVNVGDFDRAEALRKRFAIERIATLVVLDADGRRVAQSTLEPISKKQELTPESLAIWLREPTDQKSPLGL